MEKGKIIILNGVSSSGKSTLAKVLQDRSPIPLYKLDIDDFILMAPDKFNDYANNDYSVQYAFASKFFHVVKLISDFGLSIVAPYMFFKNSDTLNEFRDLLAGYPVLVVNVLCPAEELQKREIARGDRTIGSAVSQLQLLETNFDNSLSVDNYMNSNELCADTIIEAFIPESVDQEGEEDVRGVGKKGQ